MSTARPLDIKVIYSASSRRPQKRGQTIAARRKSPASRWALVGVVSLLAVGGHTYATWWPVDKFVYMVFAMKTPIPGVDVDQAAGALFPGLAAGAETEPTLSPEEGPAETPKYVGQTATIVIGVTAYSWLTLAMVASCALAVSAGAAFGRAGGSQIRRVGAILAAGSALILAWIAFDILSEYDRGFPPSYLRAWMAGLVALSTVIGMAIGRGVRGLTRLAAVTLILAGVGTAVGLYLGNQCGAVSAERSTPLAMLLAFVVHSLYGWILLPISSRLAR